MEKSVGVKKIIAMVLACLLTVSAAASLFAPRWIYLGGEGEQGIAETKEELVGILEEVREYVLTGEEYEAFFRETLLEAGLDISFRNINSIVDELERVVDEAFEASLSPWKIVRYTLYVKRGAAKLGGLLDNENEKLTALLEKMELQDKYEDLQHLYSLFRKFSYVLLLPAVLLGIRLVLAALAVMNALRRRSSVFSALFFVSMTFHFILYLGAMLGLDLILNGPDLRSGELWLWLSVHPYLSFGLAFAALLTKTIGIKNEKSSVSVQH